MDHDTAAYKQSRYDEIQHRLLQQEVFLQDIISNASDTLDKIRYEPIIDPNKFEAEPNCFIKIIPGLLGRGAGHQ